MKQTFIILFTCCYSLTLSSQNRDSFTIYVFLLDECRICQELSPELNRMYDLSKDHNIGFIGYFPNHSSSEAGVQKFRKKYKVSFNLALDHDKRIAKRFEATILPEVVIWNETKNVLVYRGAVNNLYYAPGKRRHQVSEHYVKDAIFGILKGKEPDIRITEPIGCFINYSENTF